jgi:metallophosphoesterase superfamily enzyme
MSIWEKHPKAELVALEVYKSGETSITEICKQLENIYKEEFSYNQVRHKLKDLLVEEQLDRNPFGLTRLSVNPLNKKVYLVMSDIHVPFELDNINEYVKLFVGYVDGLILAGDLLDEYAVSSFVKDKEISLQYEMVRAHNLLKQWAEWFEEVTIIKGNHDERIDNYVRKNLQPSVLFLIPENLALRHFETGFKVRDIHGNETEYEGIKGLKVENSWFIKKHDLIIAHPKNFSKVNGKTVVMTDEYFLAHGYNHRGTIIGHTHMACKITPRGDRVLMEIGCNNKPMDYSKKSGKVNYRPQVNAVAIATFYDGKIDVSETNYFTLDKILEELNKGEN